MRTTFKLLALAAAAGLLCTSPAMAVSNDGGWLTPSTGGTSAPSNWRFAPGQLFNGVAALDGVARLTFTASDGFGYACSGSLIGGGAYVLTAAHCADDFIGNMTVQFGWFAGSAAVTRTATVAGTSLHPLWQGFDNSVDRGIDLAIIKLNAPVTTIQSYVLSATNDVGKTHLIGGYGTSGTGSSGSAPSWADSSYGHYGYNTFDVTSRDFNKAVDQFDPSWGFSEAYYAPGATYMVDFDNANGAANNNTLGRVAGVTGNQWTSSTGLGVNESLIAGGDSGGGDYVWDGTQWLLSGVHSWGWGGSSVCSFINVGTNNCDVSAANTSSYGDLSGSTAVFSSLDWINSVAAVPEPQSVAMMLAGLAMLGGISRRRAARKA